MPHPFKERKKGIESREAQMNEAVTPTTVGLVFCHCVRVDVERSVLDHLVQSE